MEFGWLLFLNHQLWKRFFLFFLSSSFLPSYHSVHELGRMKGVRKGLEKDTNPTGGGNTLTCISLLLCVLSCVCVCV